jgi:AcrR family transcriptional regulator
MAMRPGPTEKGRATRQRIIEGAAAELRARGVANTSLDDIRSATSTSKSQLFHYFPEGRAQLLLAVAQHEADLVLADQQPHLDNLGSWRAWQAWRDRVVDRYREQGQHCPLSVLVSQLGPSEPSVRTVVVDLLDRWQERIAAGIRRMQAQGKIAPRLDAERTAAALLAGIQGGVLVMLATGRMSHLEAALDQAIERLRDSVRHQVPATVSR